MSSYQRVALFIFFDAIEKDLVSHVRSVSSIVGDGFLTAQEREKASLRADRSEEPSTSPRDDFDLLYQLDLGDKLAIVQRLKPHFDQGLRKHLSSKASSLQASVPVRNSVMHGRPLTVAEHATAFALASDLVRSNGFWPILHKALSAYNSDPEAITRKSITFLEDPSDGLIFHNLPLPDYDDTGFVPRPQLEQELKKKILSRHPVVTVLGDGGNGKTALTLQALYSLINSGEHDFDAVVWVSAKSSKLTVGEIQRIEHAITTSMGLFEEVVGVFENTTADAISRVRQLLENNKILLAIDNLETVLDDTIRDFVSDIPGQSKVVLTSRIPVGGDLTVNVTPLSDNEGEIYLRALIKSYSIKALAGLKPEELRYYANRLERRPLLLKWFCMGVLSGLPASKIVSNPEIALRFCLENVFDSLTDDASNALSLMAILPRAVSMGVLHHVSAVDIRRLEAGVAELLKFSILETENQSGYELNYRIKPFARAYIARILRLTAEAQEAVIRKFRNLSFAYQAERAAEGREKYNQRNFIVRSISEAIATQRLRTATKLAYGDDFQSAKEIIDALKISNYDYFEVLRAEAFICYRQHDFSGASEAYQSAIELSPDTPQLYFFYGGFLLRAYGDCPGAIAQLTKALELDPESIDVKRELARAKMYHFDFEGASKILSSEMLQPLSNMRTQLIFADLQTQNFHRMILHKNTVGIDADLEEPCARFADFLGKVDARIIDTKMLEHLRKARAAIIPILQIRGVSSGAGLLLCLDRLIGQLEETSSTTTPDDGLSQNALLGTLKEKGRKPTFGFLVDASMREYFIAKDTVQSGIWESLQQGRAVTFDAELDAMGRPRATNVRLLQG
ncbi:tetratricopeptide repeat protein [Rhizobium sp. GN54]|uniref:tetratricopeptide repeat protein n=1 Tax=Rhizobium sp. GN54 TaxID=2898150 RepID=UPI001E358F0F|nr:tetratricopeptide repeat protein [Rhizobium sp. GN54]MCD2183662.1 NB-ARC domain-containing protein [Rhizobium sp. GN54]